MKKITWIERLQYQFDNYMAKGTIALIGGLGILSVIVIVLVALIVSIFKITPSGSEPVGFGEAAWLGLMRTLDAGTMGGDEGWGFRIAMFAVTLGGVFIISTLIGVLTSGVEGKLEELRKGRSKVIESDHTIILGWSPQVYTIISELTIANENQKNPCIVVLGDKDKVEMEDAIREYVDDTKNTRVVCRSGNPIDMNDLRIVSPQTSKSIIILSQEKENPDAEVIKTLLALINSPERRKEAYHIVAEIRDPQNVSVAKMVGQSEVEVIMVGNLISRIIAQTCRQSGLSVVYTELLDFGGDEIYIKEEPQLVGKTFGDSLSAYEDSSVMGIKPASDLPMLNPPMDTVIKTGDAIIAISEDDDTLKLSHFTDVKIDSSAMVEFIPGVIPAEQNLVLGWNWRGETLISEMDNYMPTGSSIHVVSSYADDETSIKALSSKLQNTTLTFFCGNTTDREVLDSLNIPEYEHIILLCYSNHMDIQEADAVTLMSLLHLRDIAKKTQSTFSITSEMLDVRNRELAEVTQADDFIISDKIISLMLSQVSENKYLNLLFEDIFDPEGSEIYLKPAIQYITPGKAVNFYTVLEEARKRGEVAIGYRIKSYSKDASKSYGVVVNPKKSAMITFENEDKIIVIAEE
jgi:voltage-gated potassium channel Kch